MELSIVNSLPQEPWRQFVDRHPAGNIFHTPEMFEVYSRTKGYRPQLWAAVANDEILALFLPVQITLFEGFMRPLTTRAVVYGSLLRAAGARGCDASKLLLQKYTREVKGNPIFTEVRNLVDPQDMQPTLFDCGFHFEQHLNYLIDLQQPEAELWHNLSKKTRQHIHKSLSSGLIIEDMQDTKELSTAYRLLAQVYNRISVPLADKSLFTSAFELLLPKGMMKAFLVRKDQSCIGFNAFLLYKDQIYDWWRGSERTYSECQPESLLLWNILKWGSENHYRLFDFGGAGKPGEPYGPRVFKSRWGGTLVNYGRNIYTHSRQRMAISQFGYRLMRIIMFKNHISGKDW